MFGIKGLTGFNNLGDAKDEFLENSPMIPNPDYNHVPFSSSFEPKEH